MDLGIVQLATDSDGNLHGEAVEKVRRRRHEARRSYQKTGTKSAKRRLKKLARKEANFRRNENHVISKALVALAKDTARGIGLEDLTHIRERTTVRRKDRAKHSGWAFAQLQAFVTYKAKLAGVPVVIVDARNTSRLQQVRPSRQGESEEPVRVRLRPMRFLRECRPKCRSDDPR